MHDPMVVVFDVHLPLPTRKKWYDAKDGQPRWTLGRRLRTNPENLGEPIWAWYRPKGWQPRVAGRAFGTATFATVWHNEPHGRDSGSVCKGMGGSDFTLHNVRWAWKHRAHLSVQVLPYQRVHRWLTLRCGECGFRFLWKQPRFGYMNGDATYHDQCMSLRHTCFQLDDAAKALTFTADDTERWRVERWLQYRDEQANREPAS